jgi:hypothetical protein
LCASSYEFAQRLAEGEYNFRPKTILPRAIQSKIGFIAFSSFPVLLALCGLPPPSTSSPFCAFSSFLMGKTTYGKIVVC